MKPCLIGVEIGGTNLRLAYGTPEGEILELRRGGVAPEAGAQGILAWIKENLPLMLDQARATGYQPRGLGCGFGGPINTPQGRVLRSIHILGWDDYPLKEWFQTEFQLPAVIANDTNAAAWGEYRRGIGRGTRYFFYTNIGTGIGGGIIIDGSLYDGQGFGAGEFGQTFVPDWTAARPGVEERLENLCSGLSIEKRLRTPGYVPGASALMKLCDGDLTRIDCRLLHQAAIQGDPFARQEIERVGWTIGIALSNVLSLVSSERIALGGGVSNMGELLLGAIRRSTKEHEFVNSVGRYEIFPCELKGSIVLVGAILLAAEKVL
ncbi:MAG: ROK family protein [Anaerolineae bacterium]|nr:ROK family protein [Anaerolineae bacterium]MCZ7552201.1 ROK family protein [Anaerolineales bacterium]